MTRVALELLVIVALLLANGVLAMSETAIIAARRTRLQERADAGDAGARAVLSLQDEPNRFLSTVQIGITLVGILAGAFGGATLGRNLGNALADAGVEEGVASLIGVGVVVTFITYCSLIIGELVPKRFALQHAEGIASAMAGPMGKAAALSAPVVWILSISTDAALRLLRVRANDEPAVTEEEIRLFIQAGAEAGVVQRSEQDLLSAIFRLGDLTVDEIMTPRPLMVCLDVADPIEETWQRMAGNPHTWFPVARDSVENMLGVISVKDVWAHVASSGYQPVLEEVVRPALFVPGATSALSLLDSFRASAVPIAIVVDEFGGIEGLVTLTDIVEAIVGELPESHREADSIVEREDGSYLLDGLLAVRDLNERFTGMQLAESEDYHTLGGFVIAQLGRVPSVGDQLDWPGWVLEIVDMDGRRVDRVLAQRTAGEDDTLAG